MKRGSLLNKFLSFAVVIAVLMSLTAPALAIVVKSEETYGYVAIGDAMTEGIGLSVKDKAYYELVAEYLGTDSTSVADKRYRIEEIRYLLDDDYAGDGYTASIGGINADRRAGTLKEYVKNAEVISLNIGVNNFSTYIVNQMIHYLENGGEVKYSYSFDEFADGEVSKAMDEVKKVVVDRLLAAAPDELDAAVDLVDFVAGVSTYSYMSYVTSFNAVIREIYALNPDVELYVVGIYNAMEGDVLTVDADGRTVEVPIGETFGALVELANIYTQVLAPRAFDYTYVDPGTPELLIDQMGNTKLPAEDRIPDALKYELLNSVEDTAISMIQEMFAQYGIAKSDDEAYAIAEEIFAKDSSERREYIKSLIQDFAVDEVINRFKTELENYASTYGSITVTNEDIKTLLDNLDAATTESERKEVATAFVVDLMTKAMVGQTFAGIQINTQEDAYEAIARLERNSQGDPDALREAAADMIMAKVGENGLKDFITRDDVLDLLEQLDTTTSDTQREAIIDEWMNNLAVKKITAKIQAINPNYKESDAKALLAAMAGASEAERESVAKNHLLTTGGFHAYMVSKFAETYEINGLKLQTYGGFDAFVTAVEQAPDNTAAKAIVRTEIRAAAAQKAVEDPTAVRLMPDLTRDEVITLFANADAASNKDQAILDWLLDRFGYSGKTPSELGMAYDLILNPMKNVLKGAYNSYNEAATAAEDAFAEYRDGVDTAAEGFAQYVSLKDTAAQQILDAYNQQYQGAGETALKYYADYLNLRDQAVEKVLQGYDEYNRAVNLGLDTVDQFSESFENVFEQLRKIAEVEKISLNHLVAVAKKLDKNYIQSMVENLVQGDPMAAEDKTVAYIALRYYLANSMMIMPSANGHAEIANRIITAIKTGASVNSAAGELANKVINTGADIYHLAQKFKDLPTSGSGQVGVLKNPDTYVAFGDNVTSGTALSSSSKTYVQLIADALAMDYIYSDVDTEDNVYNYALNGMRAEELLALLDSNYSGDAYTEGRFGKAYIESLRAEYLENVKNADLITINVGINNLTTFPLQQTLLAYNGEETYEMDWARYFGESRANKLAKGKNAVMDLLLGIADNAESRKPVLDDLNAYEKAERALNTASTAIESLFYGLLGYAVNLDDSVETIAELNPNATIVLIGFYNPLEGTYFNVDRTVEIKDHELDLSKYTINVSALADKVINIGNRYLTNFVGDYGDATAAQKGSRVVAVPVLNTELGVTDTGASKDLSTLATWRTVSVKGHEIDIMVPEYFLSAGRNVGVNLHPNANGHAYIAAEVLEALKFEIHANVIFQEYTKYYGDEDPAFTYIIDDLSSLYGEDVIVLNISREPGEEVGEYVVSAEVTFDGYTSVTVTCGKLTIVPRPTFDGEINTGRWTMSLNSVIYLNYYPTMTGFPEGFDFANKGGVVVWTGEANPTSGSQLYVGADNTTVIKGMQQNENGEWFVRTHEIYAAHLGDIVFIRPYVEVAEGQYVYMEKAAGYSPARYCYDMLNNANEREDTRYVCAALLEYGASAQVYFNYNTDSLVTDIPANWPNADLRDYDLSFNYNYLDEVVLDDHVRNVAATLSGNKTGIIYNKATLDLQGAIRVSVGYNIDAAVIDWSKVAKANVMFWTEEDIHSFNTLENAFENGSYSYLSELTPATGTEEVSLGAYRGKSQHILAKDLSETVYYSCRIEMNDGTVYRSGLGIYSPEAFVADHLEQSSGQIVAVCERIAVYSEMARIRFEVNN